MESTRRVGKGALLRAVPTNPRRLVGTLRFAHPMTAGVRFTIGLVAEGAVT
jgi:hypothetical protein